MDQRGSQPIQKPLMWEAGQLLCWQVPLFDVDWPTDLGDSGDALWDHFEPKRSALHRQAVAAATGGASQGGRDGAGQDHHGESGKPQEPHGGLCKVAFGGDNLRRHDGRKRAAKTKKIEEEGRYQTLFFRGSVFSI